MLTASDLRIPCRRIDTLVLISRRLFFSFRPSRFYIKLLGLAIFLYFLSPFFILYLWKFSFSSNHIPRYFRIVPNPISTHFRWKDTWLLSRIQTTQSFMSLPLVQIHLLLHLNGCLTTAYNQRLMSITDSLHLWCEVQLQAMLSLLLQDYINHLKMNQLVWITVSEYMRYLILYLLID